jgi:hypothetical protein
MTKLFSIFILVFFLTGNCFGQKIRPNTSSRLQKEDPNNFYHSEEISNLDLAQMLELTGVRLFKFNLGGFDSAYQLMIMIDEVTNGKITKIDTIMNSGNSYEYGAAGSAEYYLDYIDQLKIITKQDTNKVTISLRTLGINLKKTLPYNITSRGQFFSWLSYSDTKWKLDKKTPILIFASSWKDEKYDFQRFCGVVHLKENDNNTNELLTSSPKYYLISYKISRLK